MMAHTTILAGYRITVTSYEGTGDRVGTAIVMGLSKEEVSVFVDICKLMCPRYNIKGVKLFGVYDPNPSEKKIIKDEINKILKKHNMQVEESTAWHQLEDLGLSNIDTYFRTRVCDKFTIEYIPETIYIQDVTQDFLNDNH